MKHPLLPAIVSGTLLACSFSTLPLEAAYVAQPSEVVYYLGHFDWPDDTGLKRVTGLGSSSISNGTSAIFDSLDTAPRAPGYTGSNSIHIGRDIAYNYRTNEFYILSNTYRGSLDGSPAPFNISYQEIYTFNESFQLTNVSRIKDAGGADYQSNGISVDQRTGQVYVQRGADRSTSIYQVDPVSGASSFFASSSNNFHSFDIDPVSGQFFFEDGSEFWSANPSSGSFVVDKYLTTTSSVFADISLSPNGNLYITSASLAGSPSVDNLGLTSDLFALAESAGQPLTSSQLNSLVADRVSTSDYAPFAMTGLVVMDPNFVPIPEPSSLLALSMAGSLCLLRRKRR
ncbi:PEP-CTERM sorting domain-containing protein [Roseibacillus ishigakijimensis]|uniref:PEP-CTERM sorting domain-containing protein n=1 Tax=Roseibacillus ishigakijimensis TaxID=454146 RepID=A0A934VLB2_9BACT|nr:PEP-CTERM sorting domain-containing protein [Roseibacillus ishigakijimensis]MBK1834499.1 PEP-CTERM sorting domain-containing protein [Roseibacillus ishigakijimensis]